MTQDALLTAFAATMRSVRIDLGMSQETLADKAGLHRNYVGMIERGERTPTLVAIEGIANGLGMKVSELLARAEKRR